MAPEEAVPAGNSTSLLRQMNERAIYELIRRLGPVSRPQLAAASGLSKPTVSLALANLERAGLVRHVGHRTGGAGRAALLYELRPDAGHVVGVDVGKSWLRLALADLSGEVLVRRTVRAHIRSSRVLVEQIAEQVREVAHDAGLPEVTYSVVASPGVFDPRSGTVRMAPNLPGWGRPDAFAALRERLGPHFALENDIAMAALGEQAFGLGAGVANFVFVSVGSGIGMGVVIGGQLYRGSRGAAGEIAYLPLGDRTEASRRRGMLEAVAAADAVVEAAHEYGMTGRLTAKQVFDAARAGDAAATRAVRGQAEHIARAVAAVVAVLDPELVILGGGIGRNGDLLLDPVERRLHEIAPLPPPRLAVSALDDDAVVLGAIATGLTAARERLLTERLGH